jgi:DNA-binding ferritin-like protein (Dps family)
MWIEKLVGSLEQKRRYRRNQARLDALPAPYRDAAKAVQHYLMYTGGIVDGDTLIRMQTDHLDLWEQAAADGTGVREVVGEDPAAFADDFARAYAGKQWTDRERERLTAAIAAAEREQETEEKG